MFDQRELYGIVERYASFGNHHTGTDADVATTDWLVSLLAGLGATTSVEHYSFDRFVGDAELFIGDVAVPCLPLFYSATGSFQTTELEVAHTDPAHVGAAGTLNRFFASGDAQTPLVLAIDGPDDLPVQCNRVPTETLGRPAVVIPGNWYDRVSAGARLSFEATHESATSANVLGSFGDPANPTVMVTTPLTGWTPAAGERGTGLAAAIAIAAELADRYHVQFSACSGHELNHLGLRQFLSTRDVSGQDAIHLGASVASTERSADGPPVLGDRRMVLTTAAGPTREAIRHRVADGNWTMADLDPDWPGEGGTWREAGAQVLSFLGGSTLFHTTDDIAAKATTPEAVQLATTVAIDAVELFVERDR